MYSVFSQKGQVKEVGNLSWCLTDICGDLNPSSHQPRTRCYSSVLWYGTCTSVSYVKEKQSRQNWSWGSWGRLAGVLSSWGLIRHSFNYFLPTAAGRRRKAGRRGCRDLRKSPFLASLCEAVPELPSHMGDWHLPPLMGLVTLPLFTSSSSGFSLCTSSLLWLHS